MHGVRDEYHIVWAHENQKPMSRLIPPNVRDTQPSGRADGEDSVPFVDDADPVDARLPVVLDEVAPSEEGDCGGLWRGS